MRQYQSHTGLLENGAAALGNICGSTVNQSKAVALGALEVIVASMRAHPSHAGIQENGAAALGNLSAHPSNHERARDCGAMEVRWGGRENAWAARAPIPSEDPAQGPADAPPRLAPHGCSRQAVMDAMVRHLKHVGVQENGCAAELGPLCLCVAPVGSGLLASVPELLRKPLRTSSSPLTSHPIPRPRPKSNSCAAVGNLAVNEENQAKAGRIGVVEAVIDAMNQHPRHAGVQERGCSALRNICGSFDNQVKVASVGGIQAVTNAIKNHSSHVGICERGCAALGNLTFKNPDNQNLAANCGSVEAVTGAMRSHISAAPVQERGAAALGAAPRPVAPPPTTPPRLDAAPASGGGKGGSMA